ncbi:MAG: MFS transporter, partial [Oscillospiraceae bacterium]|nr:MFS transporter [Oscillospiraceae bacterium]
LVVIGQIVSLFGNAALRFALPLYLLTQTGSSSLYGAVNACAFIPAILLSPIGGVAADRVNKRNIMVILDFFTAGVIAVYYFFLGTADLPLLTAFTLMLLYGIAGAYQPAVQASIPALAAPEQLVAANSVINIVGSFSGLTGPVLGGVLYNAYGLVPVLRMCAVCFVLSAVMEIFIHIPFIRQPSGGSVWQTVKADLAQSIRFIVRDAPAIGKTVLTVCAVNLFLSSMILVGMPYIITEVLTLENANSLCGFSEGALAAGGLLGGICAGIFAGKVKAGKLLVFCALLVFPMGAALLLSFSDPFTYCVMTACCFGLMVCSTIFSVCTMSFVQAGTPPLLTGKVIAVILMISNCAQPLGNALYGVLFEACKGYEYGVIFFAGGASLVVALQAGSLTADFF